MLSTDDNDLLGTFVRECSDDAFRQLVERYLGFVLGTALRQVRNRPLAEEVAQNVFAILARKAASLSQGALPAWLHRSTIHQSHAAMRSESRHRRKLTALAAEAPATLIDQAEPPLNDGVLRALDQALARLGEADKRVLLLRFFEGQTFPEIAEKLGQSEAAVQRRGHRALERLRLMLKRRGVALSTTGLASAFTALSAEASPMLAAQLAKRALAVAPQLGTATLFTHALATMSAAKKLSACVLGIGALAAAPVAIKLGSTVSPAPPIGSAQDSPVSHSSPGPPGNPAAGFGAQPPKTAVRLGRGKQRYSLYEATQISQQIVERLEIDGSRAVSEWVHRLSEFFTEGVLDPDDWDGIEKITKAKRRAQEPTTSREVLMRKAAAVFLEQPGRDRGGPLAFVAYHLKRLEMLPPSGTAEEQEVYDWVRAKACVDRGVFDGKSPQDVTVVEALARNHPGELAWNSALIRAYLAQGDWRRALDVADEAVATQKLSDPGRSFDAAGRAFRREADAHGDAAWVAYFSSPADFSAGYLPIVAADALFKQGISLQPTDAGMADRCWRASIGMMQLLQTDRDVGMRSEAVNHEKQFVKKLPEEAVQSIYARPAAEVKSEIEAEFASLMALSKILQGVLSSGDEAKIQDFKAAVESEGNFAVLDRMRRAQEP